MQTKRDIPGICNMALKMISDRMGSIYSDNNIFDTNDGYVLDAHILRSPIDVSVVIPVAFIDNRRVKIECILYSDGAIKWQVSRDFDPCDDRFTAGLLCEWVMDQLESNVR